MPIATEIWAFAGRAIPSGIASKATIIHDRQRRRHVRILHLHRHRVAASADTARVFSYWL
jgi:hypothetical protein